MRTGSQYYKVIGVMRPKSVPSGGGSGAVPTGGQSAGPGGGQDDGEVDRVFIPLSVAKERFGEVTVEFFPINSVVDRKETPEAVMAGVLSGDMNSIAYFTGRNPAFASMGDLIAGYDSPEQIQTFCRHGGGRDAMQELWDALLPGALHVVGCGAVSQEALVSKVEIHGVADLEGVKIRSPSGLAATVFQKAGAAPVSMSISDVFTSLEKGVIDAADASAYINNSTSGFHQVAKNPLYPGIHSMAIRQFTINKGVWDGLTEDQQVVLETVSVIDGARSSKRLRVIIGNSEYSAGPAIVIVSPIGYSCIGNTCGEHTRVAELRHERHEPAVRHTVDTNAVRVDAVFGRKVPGSGCSTVRVFHSHRPRDVGSIVAAESCASSVIEVENGVTLLHQVVDHA